jgi:DNA-binding NarL/FixJ family response regulator
MTAVAGRVTVMIVDDQPPFRAAARAGVGRVKDFDLVAELESGEAAVSAMDELDADLVLMDIRHAVAFTRAGPRARWGQYGRGASRL